MNHLRPKGRAGIIVPEGIIFQSGKSHKELRKNLVNDGLYAVVSLPSGVFAPYSGVKTSILLFNNELAKTSQEILFVKIEQDGYDLGATKRPISKNDLPTALDILNKWNTGEKIENKLAVYVEKSKITESGDHNLSGDRYRVATDYTSAKWPMVELGGLEKEEKIEFLRGQGLSKSDLTDEGKNKCIHYGEIYTLYDPVIKHVISKTDFNGKVTSLKGDVLVPATTTADALGISVARSLNEHGVIIGGDINIIRTANKFILADYLALLISNPPLKIELSKSAKGANILHLSNSDLRRLKIPLPPLEIQKQIVAELDGYQNIIAGAKAVAENWKPKIDIDPEWEMVKLGEVVDILTDYTANGSFASLKENVQYKNQKDYALLVRLTDLRKNLENEGKRYVSEHSYKFLKKSSLFGGEYLIANVGANIGDVYLMPKIKQPATLGPNMYLVKFNEKVFTGFVYVISESIIKSQVMNASVSAAQPKINKDEFRKIKIPLPPLEIQKQIVERIESERILIEGNKKLIDIYEQKIKEAIAKLWSE